LYFYPFKEKLLGGKQLGGKQREPEFGPKPEQNWANYGWNGLRNQEKSTLKASDSDTFCE
jgi:hypothetical protein